MIEIIKKSKLRGICRCGCEFRCDPEDAEKEIWTSWKRGRQTVFKIKCPQCQIMTNLSVE